MKVISLIFLISFSAPSFAYIFGKDSRIPMPTDRLPWSAVGKLTKESAGHCTATLVGRDLILTAGHCFTVLVEVSQGDQKAKYIKDVKGDISGEAFYFFPSGFNVHHNRHSKVVWVHKSDTYQNPQGFAPDSSYSAQDWALAKLEIPIGESIGFLNVETVNVENARQRTFDTCLSPPCKKIDPLSLSLPGYSGDINNGADPFVDNDCRFRDSPNLRHNYLTGIVVHDCDMTEGASGGPLLAKLPGSNSYSIVGINTGMSKPRGLYSSETQKTPLGDVSIDFYNYGVNAFSFLETLGRLR